jgi:predicted nucleotidyltransferase
MDIRTLLRSLSDHNVRFLVIGAWAMPAYGYERMTRDIDIFFEPTRANAKRLQRALSAARFEGVEETPC